MNINTDINVLASISDMNIIGTLLDLGRNTISNTKIKTTRSLQRYERAIKKTLIFFKNEEMKELCETVFIREGLSENCLAILFFNASFNNDLLNYLNQSIYFPALFSGRIAIKKYEIIACINDLKQSESAVKKWSTSTIDVMARKYLAFLEKFFLLEGGRNKSLKHKYIDDRQLIIFAYLLTKIESRSNLLESKWLNYCFLDKETFINRILQKKFMKYISVNYTGDAIKLKTQIAYKDIYNELDPS